MSTLTFSGLHQPAGSSSTRSTILAQEAISLPGYLLDVQHRIAWSKTIYLTKHELLDRLDPDTLTDIATPDGVFTVCWLYNRIPTEQEWQKISDDSVFAVHLRVSGLIAVGNGRAAILQLAQRR
jgi:hypothetical protein